MRKQASRSPVCFKSCAFPDGAIPGTIRGSQRSALPGGRAVSANALPLFPTTVVGSMPRPQYVKDLLAAGSRTGQHDAGWQRRMDDAVRYIIGMQEQAGIDIVSDGEWRRETYVDVVAEIMSGYQWIKRDVFAYHQVVTERMKPLKPGVIAEEARFLRQNTD